jgi:hypothetical protein
MSKDSYAEKIKNANLMLAGIKSKKDILSNHGINDSYIEKFSKLTETWVTLNSVHEKAKADMMDLTRQLEESLDKLERELQFCKRVVRTDIPTTQWKEFDMIYHYTKPNTKEEENPPEEKKEKQG